MRPSRERIYVRIMDAIALFIAVFVFLALLALIEGTDRI
jgi:hypothetical protein